MSAVGRLRAALTVEGVRPSILRAKEFRNGQIAAAEIG